MNSLIASCSTTHKIDKPNQDFCTTFINHNLRCSGVIVADGLGSHKCSELSARHCSEFLRDELIKLDKGQPDFEKLFLATQSELIDYSKNQDQELIEDSLMGTTLICAIEFEKEIQIAYVGNGCAMNISGYFNQLSAAHIIPWNAVNVLSPHAIEEDGRPSLYKYVSISQDVSCRPTIVTISKEEVFGNIIVIGTDGIFTNDERSIGKDNQGTVWQLVENQLVSLYSTFENLFGSSPKELKDEDLKIELERYLENLLKTDHIDDDTTLGVIVCREAIEYQERKSITNNC